MEQPSKGGLHAVTIRRMSRQAAGLVAEQGHGAGGAGRGRGASPLAAVAGGRRIALARGHARARRSLGRRAARGRPLWPCCCLGSSPGCRSCARGWWAARRSRSPPCSPPTASASSPRWPRAVVVICSSRKVYGEQLGSPSSRLDPRTTIGWASHGTPTSSRRCSRTSSCRSRSGSTVRGAPARHRSRTSSSMTSRLEPWTELRALEVSAWPYTTADAIWRALLEELAGKIFDCGRETQADDGVDEAWRARLRRAALADALTLSPSRAIRLATSTTGSSRGSAAPDRSRTARPTRAARLPTSWSRSLRPSHRVSGRCRRLFGHTRRRRRRTDRRRRCARALVDRRPARRPARSVRPRSRRANRRACSMTSTGASRRWRSTYWRRSRSSSSRAPGRPERHRAARRQCLFLVAADERLVAQGLRARFGPTYRTTRRVRIWRRSCSSASISRRRTGRAYALVAEWAPEWAAAADLIVADLAATRVA